MHYCTVYSVDLRPARHHMVLLVHRSPTQVNRAPSVLYIYLWVDIQMIRGLVCALAHKVLTKLSRGWGANAKEIFCHYAKKPLSPL